MRVIKYKFGGNDVEIQWSAANENLAAVEADNGVYTVEDNGEPEPEAVISAEERLEALEAAMLELMGVSLND